MVLKTIKVRSFLRSDFFYFRKYFLSILLFMIFIQSDSNFLILNLHHGQYHHKLQSDLMTL